MVSVLGASRAVFLASKHLVWATLPVACVAAGCGSSESPTLFVGPGSGGAATPASSSSGQASTGGTATAQNSTGGGPNGNDSTGGTSGTTTTGGRGTGSPATGGTTPATGGTAPATGGNPTATGGAAPATGGTAPTAGGNPTATGGTASGGKASSSGGSAVGGSSTGGRASGGSSTGGSGTAGAATGGASSTTGGGSSTGNLFSQCRFHFGTIDSKARSNATLLAELDMFTSGWIGSSENFNLNGVCTQTNPAGAFAGKVPALVSYIIAFTARRDENLQDCNVSSSNNLCNYGATYIRAHLNDRIIPQYVKYAQGFA